jgi:hypothetical protein
MTVIDNDGIAVFRQRITPANHADDPDPRIIPECERVGDLDSIRVQSDYLFEMFPRMRMAYCNRYRKWPY